MPTPAGTRVTRAPGHDDLPTLQLHAGGARAELYRHGAHVTGWSTADGVERLFVSSRSSYGGSAAIRGGIPVIFPQFGGLGPLPKHGFARTGEWEEDGASADGEAPWVRLRLRDTDGTRALWPHRFAARLTVALDDAALRVALEVANAGDAPFTFTAALHTYLRVDDAGAARVVGLRGCRYREGEADREEASDAVTFPGEVDRIYRDVPRTLRLEGAAGGSALSVGLEGFPDAVVWNPGEARARALADLGPGEERRFVCIEAAAALSPVTLAPGARWEGAQRLVAAP